MMMMMITTNKKTEKLSKYKDPEIEISRMWNVRTKTVPVIIVALGTIKKGLGSEPSVASRSPAGHRATEDYTNEHCIHRL
jgi:hypothetical protein